jgi:hypothetical protein
MRRAPVGLICLSAFFLISYSLLAQDPAQVSISPSSATMLVGDARPFRAVDGKGHTLRGVHWTVSRPELVDLQPGDEVEIMAKQVGSFTLTAHTSAGFADAQIEVLRGSTLPMGTVKWSVADLPGCHTTKITPAVPSPNGPDVFEESACADGTYIRALTADGVLLWRRKIDSTPHPGMLSQHSTSTPTAASLHASASSICDAISMGMQKSEVEKLTTARQLGAPIESPSGVWLIEEEGAQCKLWFDAGSQVVKKRKILITE